MADYRRSQQSVQEGIAVHLVGDLVNGRDVAQRGVDRGISIAVFATQKPNLRAGFGNELNGLRAGPSTRLKSCSPRNPLSVLDWAMDPQTIAIVSVGVAILGVLLGLVVPIGLALVRRVDRLTQVVTALANHHHEGEGALPSFTVPAD